MWILLIFDFRKKFLKNRLMILFVSLRELLCKCCKPYRSLDMYDLAQYSHNSESTSNLPLGIFVITIRSHEDRTINFFEFLLKSGKNHDSHKTQKNHFFSNCRLWFLISSNIVSDPIPM